MEDSEDKSESNEKETSEKEDSKEKEKITQDNTEERMAIMIREMIHFPEFRFYHPSVYLEYTTPPPEQA